MKVNRKFYALRFVASLHIFFGWLLCIAAVLIFFFGLNAPSLFGIPVTLFALYLFMVGLMMMVVGELCYVFLGIEENTRTTNELLQNYLQNKDITPVVEENERKISMSSIWESITSDKEKLILVGSLVLLVIVFFILKQLGLVQ